MCNSDGHWKEIDFSNCTMKLDADPFIAIEVQQFVNDHTNPTDMIDSITSRVCRNIIMRSP